MRSEEFQKILLKAAVSSIACDGHIDDREIQELKQIADNEIYFIGFDYTDLLNEHLEYIKCNGIIAINELLDELGNSNLNPNQKLLLLEVVIRIIEADKKIEQIEIKFLQLIKTRLNLTDELVITKFPRYINYLLNFENEPFNFDFSKHIHSIHHQKHD